MSDLHTNFDSPLAASAPDEQTNLSSLERSRYRRLAQFVSAGHGPNSSIASLAKRWSSASSRTSLVQ
jgi:hypothetical protein